MNIGDEVNQVKPRNRRGIIKDIDWPLYLVHWFEENDEPKEAVSWISHVLIRKAISATEYFALLEAIDAALDSRDEKLFKELSTKLLDYQQKTK